MSEGKVGECPFRGKASGDMKCPHRDLGSIMDSRAKGSVIDNLYPFYQSKIAHGLDEFYMDHLDKFDPDEEENKLVYWDIFKEFEQLFEGYLNDFVEEQGLDQEEFREELSKFAEDKGQRSCFLVKMIAAQTDYDFFVNLMKDKARDARSRAAHK
eukprot:CAMPEP_0171488494 /NCGR_PEP_ID=MMETSP0958-20121227/2234_1 /TAXON_ID=87120 /ORGANISM="Aurantiochytrium limacinum, Strain ATCCMYA-1381" /LENGTH=154 /DNA_ID=CAMNT_0012021605 /DNA_START=1 /DNA_END=465 /DNA_ORIENTATION=+